MARHAHQWFYDKNCSRPRSTDSSLADRDRLFRLSRRPSGSTRPLQLRSGEVRYRRQPAAPGNGAAAPANRWTAHHSVGPPDPHPQSADGASAQVGSPLSRENVGPGGSSSRSTDDLVRFDTSGNVQVYIHMESTGEEHLAQLRALGAQLEVVNEDAGIV